MTQATGKSLRLDPERGRGVWLFDSNGGAYLDGVSGTFNLPLGYNHPRIVAALEAQLAQLTHQSSDLFSGSRERLSKRLVELAPPEIGACWLRDVTGSTAIECAIKIAQKATGAIEVITLFHSHHGQTYFTTSISGPAFRRASFSGMASSPALRVPTPYCYRCFYAAQYPDCNLLCVERIDEFLKYASSGNVACIVVEPILGNGGNIVPPPGYFEALVDFCHKRKILIIADEVQTGIGRTGHMYASGALGLRPDMIVLAKGLGGIGMPVGAVLMRRDLDILEKYEHSFTSGAHPLGIAAASATVDIISAPGFLDEVRSRGEQLGVSLRHLQRRFSCIGDVRGMGMMWGLEFIDSNMEPLPRFTNRVVEIARARYKLILRSSQYGRGNVVKVRPALNIESTEMSELVGRLESAIAETCALEGITA